VAQEILVRFKGDTRHLDRATKRVESSMMSIGSLAGVAAAALGAIGGAALISSTVNTIRKFEDLKNTLITIEGDAIRAAHSMKLIEDFTAGTVFQLDEVTNAFITFKNAGLKPTTEFMTNVGNIAAGMGKRIDNVAQAVFNATTGEFEMLKQLGIKVKTEGDKLTVNFRGTRTTIDNDGKAILGFIEDIGKTEFSGALERSANTLSGAISNLEDNVGLVQKAFGDGGFRDASTDFIKLLQEAVIGTKDFSKMLGKEVGFAIFQATKFLKEMNFDMGSFIQGAKIAISVLGGAGLLAVLKGITGGVKSLTLAMARNPLGLLAVAAASLITYLSMENGLGRTISQVTRVLKVLGSMAADVGKYFKDKLITVMEFLTGAFDKFVDGVISGYNAIANFIPFLDQIESSGKDVRESIKGLAVDGMEFMATKVEQAKEAVVEFIDTNELAQDALKAGQGVIEQLTEAWVDQGLTYDQATKAARAQYEEQYKLNEEIDVSKEALDKLNASSKEAAKAVEQLTEAQQKLNDASLALGLPTKLKEQSDSLIAFYDMSIRKANEANDFIRVGRETLVSREILLEEEKFHKLESLNENFYKAVDSMHMSNIERRLTADMAYLDTVKGALDKDFLQRKGNEERTGVIVKDRIEFEKKSELEKTQFALQQGSKIFDALGAQNKKAFQIAKAFNIANAIMNTYMGATKALATYPPPFNFIAAAGVVAMGLAQVAQIKSQSYSGRQLGGPVMGGQSYIVGENGPEMFTPSTTGNVTRNGDLQQQRPVEITFNINAIDTQSIDELLVERRSVITQVVSDAMLESGQRSRF
tara:strand:+ start:3457 stop:5898 length:2442 start_codon:yes stop_codon:yes gene_type:complete